MLLRWEGAPDTGFFRAQAWSYLHELPEGAQVTGADGAPRFRVDVTVPHGALSERRKAGLVEEATATVLKAAGLTEADAVRVWVLVHEQADGTWGAGGHVIRYADLVRLARARRMRELTYVARRSVEWREVPDPVLRSRRDAVVAPVAATPCDVDSSILAGHGPIPPELHDYFSGGTA